MSDDRFDKVSVSRLVDKGYGLFALYFGFHRVLDSLSCVLRLQSSANAQFHVSQCSFVVLQLSNFPFKKQFRKVRGDVVNIGFTFDSFALEASQVVDAPFGCIYKKRVP